MTSMPLLMREIPATDVPMELLLLADPPENKIRSYLSRSRCFVASTGGVAVGVCIVQPLAAGAHELMSIAVRPVHPESGHGTPGWNRGDHFATYRRIGVGGGADEVKC